ncbi:phospholipase/carboxylesterase [Arthrobacter sp. ov407]|uniref:alpha/beta hydrolase n=1 Tax=Arthrobacter sp. ov407 TaxID=1761748 RepID=UPI0008860604|nr:phospholipase [Arthrobacter sp. ov407]SDK69101.1 phospholipase/carboxylesterase [Arthrobacter sp. ov407]
MTQADAFPTPVVLWSKPEQERAGKPLLVLLHGYGANEQDLLSLADMLPEDFAVASVRAPLVTGPGFTWFPLTASIDYSLDAVKAASGYVLDWIDSVKANHPSVTLLGFSMGMAMATTLLRQRPADFAAVVGLSGFVIDAGDDPSFLDGDLDGTVPLFWGRDQQDPVITEDKIDYTIGWVRKHVKLTKVLYTGMWHGINQQEVGHVSEFLTHVVLNSKK